MIVTAATMTLHAAIALERRIILFNKVFNKAEFELYGLGEIIEPEVDCLGCYKENCEKKCMDMITVEQAVEAIERQLENK